MWCKWAERPEPSTNKMVETNCLSNVFFLHCLMMIDCSIDCFYLKAQARREWKVSQRCKLPRLISPPYSVFFPSNPSLGWPHWPWLGKPLTAWPKSQVTRKAHSSDNTDTALSQIKTLAHVCHVCHMAVREPQYRLFHFYLQDYCLLFPWVIQTLWTMQATNECDYNMPVLVTY